MSEGSISYSNTELTNMAGLAGQLVSGDSRLYLPRLKSWGSELWSLQLHVKHLNYWVIFIAQIILLVWVIGRIISFERNITEIWGTNLEKYQSPFSNHQQPPWSYQEETHACVSTCMHLCMYTHMLTHSSTHMHSCIHTHKGMHTYMYAHTFQIKKYAKAGEVLVRFHHSFFLQSPNSSHPHHADHNGERTSNRPRRLTDRQVARSYCLKCLGQRDGWEADGQTCFAGEDPDSGNCPAEGEKH